MARAHRYVVTVTWTGNTGSGTSGYKSYERRHAETDDAGFLRSRISRGPDALEPRGIVGRFRLGVPSALVSAFVRRSGDCGGGLRGPCRGRDAGDAGCLGAIRAGDFASARHGCVGFGRGEGARVAWRGARDVFYCKVGEISGRARAGDSRGVSQDTTAARSLAAYNGRLLELIERR